MPGWVCCPDGQTCAASYQYCSSKVSGPVPIEGATGNIQKVDAKTKAEACPGTQCPGGCCPHYGWVCCPDRETCASSWAYCP